MSSGSLASLLCSLWFVVVRTEINFVLYLTDFNAY